MTFSIFLFSLLLLMGIGNITYAANDDPGAGRLSGEHISDEFYDTDSDKNSISPFKLPGLRRFGSSSSKSPYTGSTYTHQAIFDSRTIMNGIDVSKYQGKIDWNKVKAAGIDFAFIQVGYRGYGSAGTLNSSTKDPYYETNMQNAIALWRKSRNLYFLSGYYNCRSKGRSTIHIGQHW